jgi:hypothetical protein
VRVLTTILGTVLFSSTVFAAEVRLQKWEPQLGCEDRNPIIYQMLLGSEQEMQPFAGFNSPKGSPRFNLRIQSDTVVFSDAIFRKEVTLGKVDGLTDFCRGKDYNSYEESRKALAKVVFVPAVIVTKEIAQLGQCRDLDRPQWDTSVPKKFETNRAGWIDDEIFRFYTDSKEPAMTFKHKNLHFYATYSEVDGMEKCQQRHADHVKALQGL